MVRELAKKYDVNVDQIIDLIAHLGIFTTAKIKEEGHKIIYYPNWGKYMPLARRQFKEKFDATIRKKLYEDYNNSTGQKEEDNRDSV